jgi:hypothetical protein
VAEVTSMSWWSTQPNAIVDNGEGQTMGSIDGMNTLGVSDLILGEEFGEEYELGSVDIESSDGSAGSAIYTPKTSRTEAKDNEIRERGFDLGDWVEFDNTLQNDETTAIEQEFCFDMCGLTKVTSDRVGILPEDDL